MKRNTIHTTGFWTLARQYPPNAQYDRGVSALEFTECIAHMRYKTFFLFRALNVGAPPRSTQ
ncbi:hypothetical protein DmGdi_02370 [Gluconobacter sp. Gdi]|nr:hypothetical protein DmGdi_02370 [Gluconobacter sp. Gdi]